MSDTALKLAGHYSVEEFTVTSADRKKSVDIKMLVHTFNIIESMSAGSVRGSAVVYDAFDLVTQFPLKAEELIKIVYSDFFGTKRTEYYHLYSITDVKYAKDSSQSMIEYKINFVSVGKFYSENFRVQKAYKPNGSSGLISDYVQDVFDEYYVRPLQEDNVETKNIVIVPTTGPQVYVIPRYTPEQTMQFFSRKAYLAASTTQSFRFFENREMYFFATNEYMIERLDPNSGRPTEGPGGGISIPSSQTIVPQFRMNYVTDKGPTRQLAMMNEIINIDFGFRTDAVADINSGAYKKNAYEIDILNGVVVQIAYDHSTAFESTTEKLMHDPDYVEKRLSKPKERFVIKDYNSTGVAGGDAVRNDQFYADLHNIKSTTFYHYNANKIGVSIYGRNTIFAGSVIDLQLLVNTVDTKSFKIDKERSGRYIVESVENLFYENVYTQKLTLARGGIGI